MKPQKEAGRYAQLLLGAAILAFGLFNVHQQSRITEGGVLGATLLLQHWLGISPAISEVVMDVACYLLGIKYLGKGFLRYSLVATGGFAVFYALFARMGYLLPSMAHLGLVVRAGGAAGGDDALALVIAKLFRWPVSRAYLFTDLVVLVLSLSYIPVANIVCSLLTVTLSSFVIGKIHTYHRSKA